MKHGPWAFPSCYVNRQSRYSRHWLPFRHISPWRKKTSVLESSVVCPCHYRMPCDLCSLVDMWYGSLALKRIIIISSSEPHTEDTLKTETWGPGILHDFKVMRKHTCVHVSLHMCMTWKSETNFIYHFSCSVSLFLLFGIVWYCCLELVYEAALLSCTGIISVCCQAWLFLFFFFFFHGFWGSNLDPCAFTSALLPQTLCSYFFSESHQYIRELNRMRKKAEET